MIIMKLNYVFIGNSLVISYYRLDNTVMVLRIMVQNYSLLVVEHLITRKEIFADNRCRIVTQWPVIVFAPTIWCLRSARLFASQLVAT